MNVEDATEDALVICTRNRASTLRGSLNLLTNSCIDLPSLIVIVDSSDNSETQSVVEEVSRNCPTQITYIRSLPGLPHQRNVGAYHVLSSQKSHSRFLFFLDDDVVPDRDYFKETRILFAAHPKIGVLGGTDSGYVEPNFRHLRRFLGFAGSGQQNISTGGFGTVIKPSLEIVQCLWVPGGMQTIRGALLQLEAFNGRIRMYGEDIDMHLRLARHTEIAMSNRLRVRHFAVEAGKDSPNVLAFFEDSFRWRLSQEHPHIVRGSMVFMTTLGLIVFDLVRTLKDKRRLSSARGHVMFLFSLVSGKQSEQFVTHSEWFVSPRVS